MGDTTSNRGYRKPTSTDGAANLTDYWRHLADDVDADVTSILAFFTPSTWTPVLTGTSNPTYTVNEANVFNIGKLVIANFFLTFITAGSGAYSISVPFATTGNTGAVLGSANIGSGSTWYDRGLWENGGSSAAIGDQSAGRVSNSSPVAVAAGIKLSGTLIYFKA